MDESAARSFLSSLSREQQMQFLGGLCHEITISARQSYDRAEGVAAPDPLRTLTEVLHRLTGILANALCDEKAKFPDAFIATIFFGERGNRSAVQLLSRCFEAQMANLASPTKSMQNGSESIEIADGEVRAWIEQGVTVHIRAVDPHGDPVELTSADVEKLALALLQFRDTILARCK